MTNKEARRRYFKVFFPAMTGYIISIFGISTFIDKTAEATPLTYVLALIPAIFVFLWVWSHARFVLEMDEFARMLQIRSVLCGLIGLMVLTTAWGLLEFYTPVPAIPIFLVLPGFYFCYGIASFFVAKTYNVTCKMP